MAQIVFRHFRVDPDVVDGDQRHHRVTGGGELTDIGAQVGAQARRSGAHLRVRQIQFCLFHGGRGAAQLGVVFLVAALLFARAISSRRSEIVPWSSRYRRSSRLLSWRALTSLACAARNDACAESMPAVLAPICRRVASRSCCRLFCWR
ncbi:hypothetical protein G6F57_020129 [Rhizopus arrhizus]|nr:hypothetical protein G6F57_020129 [Rhizopus arrhizus]